MSLPKFRAHRSPVLHALVACALLAPAGPAQASGGDRIPGSRYVSGRGAALGDAYIGFADTIADGLFYNPAALAKVEGFSFEPLNMQVQANTKLTSIFGTNFYQFRSLDSYRTQLAEHPGQSAGGSAAFLPSFGFKGFGAGVLYQSRLMAEVIGADLRYRTTYQLIPAAGGALNLASGVLRLGYTLQWVNQASGDRTVAANTQPIAWNEGISEGRGFSHNLGMTLTLPYQYQPSIHVVARNVGGTSFSGKPLFVKAKNPAGTIADEEMTIDAAAGIITKFGSGMQLATQVQYRDGTDTSGAPPLKRVSAGLELSASERFFMRAGYGSGYPSAGFGLRTPRAEANFAWFSEDLGTAAKSERDIRYLFHLIFKAF